MGLGAVRRAAAASIIPVVVMATASSCASSGGGEPEDEPTSRSPSPSATASASPQAIQDAVLEAGVTGSGLPEGVTPPDDSGSPGAAWAPDEGLLYVITFGSSTCPIVAEPEATAAGGVLTVKVGATSDGPCTMDFVPTTSVVGVPDDVDENAPVTVDLGDQIMLDVQPRSAAGSAGPVTWAPTPG
ncbi:hypothetical protein GXP71_05560 [Cellulomonas sp. H30R-01]|jgi:hypothetical protein|uniref:hypothetical protein n=1 Tax=Cellulomonas sp. H30R-01 TaxID=2704467 RepID=UPI00138B56D4|nr:hypothetical protein [Cellulomonas sp. H30R-01]QHT55606.1 hypothetical protein GXP71_05560 [Cellulomonas sp. H30R-01]